MDTELSIHEAMRVGLRLHHEGRIEDAFKIYSRVLKLEPQHPDALHYMGLLAYQQGEYDVATQLMRRAAALVPDCAPFRSNLANVLIATDRLEEAEQLYREALALAPDQVDALYNYGVLLKALQRIDDAERLLLRAIELNPMFLEPRNSLAGLYASTGRVELGIKHLCEALIRDPKAARSRELLGIAYGRLGQFDEAARIYREWLDEEPDNAIAAHHLAAVTGKNVPMRASDAFIREEFDTFSTSFDAKLATLEYRAPSLIGDTIGAVASGRSDLDVLDIGCGTGLCGLQLRRHAQRLVGVDLSPGMLEQSRRRGLYDELVEAELTTYLDGQPDMFDVIVSGDTLVYFGVLDQALAAAAKTLRRGGHLCFTVEALDVEATDDFRLLHHGRYAHSKRYLDAALARSGLVIEKLESAMLRYEGALPVIGWLVLATRAAS